MQKINPKTIKIVPMKVASFQASGDSPVFDALEKLYEWAKPKGLLNNLNNMEKGFLFGFDCQVIEGKRKSPGYEVWIKIPSEITPEPSIKVKEFPSGLFLTAPCHIEGNHTKAIQVNSAKLNAWAQDNGFRVGNQQLLERFSSFPLADDFTIDLYQPIKINTPGLTEDEYIRLINRTEEDDSFKKLNTEQKIKKLKENIEKIAQEFEDKDYAQDIEDIKNDLRSIKAEIDSLKEMANVEKK